MQQKKYIRYAAVALMVVLFLLSFMNVVDIIASFFEPPDRGAYQEKDITLKEFELVNKALEIKAQGKDFIYEGTFDSPFRKLSFVPGRRAGSTPKKQKPVKNLFLKGTLIKENALAILEDEDGKTYICKQGDYVHNRLVAKITEDEVTITDAGGSTVLKVKER